MSRSREDIIRRIVREVLLHEHEMSQTTIRKPVAVGQAACPDCKGTGVYVPFMGPEEPCKTCRGSGIRPGHRGPSGTEPKHHVVNPIFIDDDGDELLASVLEWGGDVVVGGDDRWGNTINSLGHAIIATIETDLDTDVFLDNASDGFVLATARGDDATTRKWSRMKMESLKKLADMWGSTHVIDNSGFVYGKPGKVVKL